jgi:hypothetical protein
VKITGIDIFAFGLLGVIAFVGWGLMFHHVDPEGSHGLLELIAILAVVSGMFIKGYVDSFQHRPNQPTETKAVEKKV